MTHQQETDWSKVPKGTLVEVRNYDDDDSKWKPAYFMSYNQGYDQYPFRVEYGLDEIGYKHCRLYEGPDVLVWRDWHGGECPLSANTWCIIKYRGGEVGFCTDAECIHWVHKNIVSDIIKYCIIEPPVGVGDE